MRVALDSGYVSAPPPPPPPPPPPHKVQAGETVQSVAQHYNVTPQALAHTNHITVDASLHAGQVLQLPATAYVADTPSAEGGATAQTPQQKTDAAARAYQQALKDGENPSVVNRDRADFEAAVQAEINGKVADATNGVPPEYQTPAAQLIKTYGGAVAARYAGDSTIKAVAQGAGHDLQVKNTADSLIPGFAGPWKAAEKLQQIDLQGQPQEVVDAVLADPRVQGWIKQAAADVGKSYAGVGDNNLANAYDQANAAAKNLSTSTAGMSPQVAAAVLQASMPTIQKIAQLQSSIDIAPFDCVYSAMSRLGNDAGSQAVMAQAAQAFADHADRLPGSFAGSPEGAVANQASVHTDARFALALADAYRANGNTGEAGQIERAAAAGIGEGLQYQGNGPKAAYEKAHKAAQDKDSHLAELLAAAGPLTKDQQQAYIKAYREDPDNARVYKADADAAKKLGDWMQANRKALIFAAGNDSNAATQVYGMMKDLAQSGQGVTALQLAGDIRNDPAAAAAFGKFSDYKSQFLPDAVKAAQGELLVESDGNTGEAGNQLLELADPVFKGTDGWQQVKENYARLANGDTRAFNAAEFAKGYKEMGAVGKAWAVASIVTSSVNGASAQQVSDMIGAFATAGATTDGLATGAAQTLADAGRLGRYAESAAAFARFASRFVPALGVVASSAAFASDFGKAKSGNPAYAVALMGDMFSVIGGVLETTGVGEIPGAIVSGIGLVLSAPFEFVGGLIEGNKEAAALQREEEKYLGQIGEDAATSKAMAQSDPQQVKDLLATGMTAGQIQELGALVPGLMQSVHKGAPSFQGVPALQKRTGLSGNDLYRMLKAADAGGKSGEGTAYMAYVLGHPNWFPQVAGAQDKAELVTALQGVQKQLNGLPDSKDQVRALQQAVQWLESH